MTNEREFGPGVDLDLLADYIGGALDGTPEEAAVERLVADDPAWARAYADTSAAIEAVRVDLSALSAVHEEMPAEVVGRLEAALAPVLPAENGNVVELARRRARTRGGRWARRLAPVAVAAGVLISVALGASLLRDSASDNSATTSAGDRAAAPGAGQPQFSSGETVPPAGGSAAKPDQQEGASGGPLMKTERAPAVPMVTSGTNYTRDTLSSVASRTATEARSGPGASDADAETPAELRRLTDPAALDTCLDLIRRVAEEPEAALLRVDLARFEGSPAVVVVFTDRIWVSGPQCGLVGTDTLFATGTQGR